MQTGTEEPIRYQPYDKPARILGVYLSPESNFSSDNGDEKETYAARLNSPRIKQDSDTFMRTT
jgi:hypothetical protein